jgi:hypothetical protein
MNKEKWPHIVFALAVVSVIAWMIFLVSNESDRQLNVRLYAKGYVAVAEVENRKIVLEVKSSDGTKKYEVTLLDVAGKVRPRAGDQFFLSQNHRGRINMCSDVECFELSENKELSLLFVGVETRG